MDLHELLRTKESSEIFSLLLSSSKFDNANHPGYLIHPEYLVHYLLSSNEKVVECKILTLLNLFSVSDNSFKRILSCTPEIYEYAFKMLYLQCSQRILQVLRLLTLFCRQSQSEGEMSHSHTLNHNTTFKPVNCLNKPHLKIQDMIRTSGCLRQMCLLFILLNQGNTLWTAICECLTESCTNKIENQKQSSHILPKCLNELNKPMNDILKVGIINLVISLLKKNEENCEMFLRKGGILCIHKHFLSIPEGLELLYILIENSSSAVQQCLKNKTMKKINHILTEAPEKTKSIKDLKWLHWITLITLKLSRMNCSVPSQMPPQTVDPDDDDEKNFKKPHCITHVNKNNLLEKDQGFEGNRSFFRSSKTSKSFRSKYDAISNMSLSRSQDSQMSFPKPLYHSRRPLKSRESTLNVTKTPSQYSDKIYLPKTVHKFSPKHFSTPQKTTKDFLNYTRKFTKNYNNVIRTTLTCLDALNNSTTMIPFETEGSDNEKDISKHKVKNLVNKFFKHYYENKLSDKNKSDIKTCVTNNIIGSKEEFGNYLQELNEINQFNYSSNFGHCLTNDKFKNEHNIFNRNENESMLSIQEGTAYALQDLTQKTQQDKNDRGTVYKFFNYSTMNIKNDFCEEYLDNTDSKRLDAESISFNCQSKNQSPELSSHNMTLNNSTPNITCRKKCKELQMLINKLQTGIRHYGLNFHVIGKQLWPEDKMVTPSYLQKVYLTHIVQK